MTTEDLDPEECRELERFRQFLHARKRLRRHRKVLAKHGAKREADLFSYQAEESPYFDKDWNHVDMTRIRADQQLVVSVALGDPV